jgi:hypothetical protein
VRETKFVYIKGVTICTMSVFHLWASGKCSNCFRFWSIPDLEFSCQEHTACHWGRWEFKIKGIKKANHQLSCFQVYNWREIVLISILIYNFFLIRHWKQGSSLEVECLSPERGTESHNSDRFILTYGDNMQGHKQPLDSITTWLLYSVAENRAIKTSEQ